MSFRDDVRKQNLQLGILSASKQKTVKSIKVVNCNINAAIKLQCTYNDAIRTLFAQCTQPMYSICQQIICVEIEVEYFCDNIIYHNPTSMCIFL